MLGEQLNPILLEIEDAILEFDIEIGTKPNYSLDGFRAATKIFMSALMDKLWELQDAEKIPQEDRENMATKCGEDLRKFIKTYTDIDTFDLYK